MGKRGPKPINPEELYALAAVLYQELRRVDEGSVRWRYEKMAAHADNIQLDDEQRHRARQVAEEEIRSGRLDESQREEKVREIEELQLSQQRFLFREVDAVDAARQMRAVAGEPEVIDRLLRAKDAKQVRRICKDAPNWPIVFGDTLLPHHLSKYAAEFIAARNHKRFPGKKRPSNRLKQLWFLSRALAGAVFGVETRTAINLVGSIRPEQSFANFRAAKSARRKRRKK